MSRAVEYLCIATLALSLALVASETIRRMTPQPPDATAAAITEINRKLEALITVAPTQATLTSIPEPVKMIEPEEVR